MRGKKDLVSTVSHKIADEIREGGSMNCVIVLQRIVENQATPARPGVRQAGSAQHADRKGRHLSLTMNQYGIDLTDFGRNFPILCGALFDTAISDMLVDADPWVAKDRPAHRFHKIGKRLHIICVEFGDLVQDLRTRDLSDVFRFLCRVRKPRFCIDRGLYLGAKLWPVAIGCPGYRSPEVFQSYNVIFNKGFSPFFRPATVSEDLLLHSPSRASP